MRIIAALQIDHPGWGHNIQLSKSVHQTPRPSLSKYFKNVRTSANPSSASLLHCSTVTLNLPCMWTRQCIYVDAGTHSKLEISVFNPPSAPIHECHMIHVCNSLLRRNGSGTKCSGQRVCLLGKQFHWLRRTRWLMVVAVSTLPLIQKSPNSHQFSPVVNSCGDSCGQFSHL